MVEGLWDGGYGGLGMELDSTLLLQEARSVLWSFFAGQTELANLISSDSMGHYGLRDSIIS